MRKGSKPRGATLDHAGARRAGKGHWRADTRPEATLEGMVWRMCTHRDPFAGPALRVGVRAHVEARELCNRRKARKSFEHDPSQDPDGGAIPDITYPHLGNRTVGHVEKRPSAVQRLQDRSTDLLGVWRQDPTPMHPFGLDNFKGLQNTRRGQVCLCADLLAVLAAHYEAGQSLWA